MKKIMKNDTVEIEPIPEELADTRRLMEIRFDCLATMYDYGIKQPKSFLASTFTPKRKSQWFRSVATLTLEDIKYSDPYNIGIAIKQQYQQLENLIKQYENE